MAIISMVSAPFQCSSLNNAPRITAAAAIDTKMSTILLTLGGIAAAIIFYFFKLIKLLMMIKIFSVNYNNDRIIKLFFTKLGRQINYATKTDIRFGGILVFILACAGLKKITNIFPASATHNFTLHAGRI